MAPRARAGARVRGAGRRRLREVDHPAGADAVDGDTCATAVRRLRAEHDDARGGFGPAPKFPPSMVLEFLLRHHARTGVGRCPRDGDPHVRRDGTRRDVRPARRWVRAVCRRRRLGRPPLREDALRQRPAAAGVHPRVAHHRRRPRPTGRRRDGRLPPARPPHGRGRVRVRARRRHGRRRSLPRGAHLRLVPRAARGGPRDPRTAAAPPRCSRSPRRGRSSTACPPSSCETTRTTPTGGRGPGPACWRPATGGHSRAGTTRSSPPGTGWRSPRSPRQGPCSSGPTSSRPPPPPRTSSSRPTSSTGRSGGRRVAAS